MTGGSTGVLRSPGVSKAVFLAVIALASAVVAESYTIPPEKVDEQKVFWGSPAQFSKPAEVDYKAAVMETDEFKSIKKNKIEPGTAKYWLLISQASERVVKAIAAVAKDTGHDLVVAKGYLAEIGMEVPVEDLTGKVLERIKKKE